jgi:methionyl aminopeptidase
MFRQQRVEYKSADQIRTMREAGLVLASALDQTVAAARVGVSTRELDGVFAAVLKEAGATSNFLGYHASRPASAPP